MTLRRFNWPLLALSFQRPPVLFVSEPPRIRVRGFLHFFGGLIHRENYPPHFTHKSLAAANHATRASSILIFGDLFLIE